MPTWLLIIIINGVLATILGLLVYIWRSQESRIKKIEEEGAPKPNKELADKVRKLEDKDELSISELIKHPVLTVDSHETICVHRLGEIKAFVIEQAHVIMKAAEDSEKRTSLAIENAILKASKNGGNGTSRRRK